MAKILFLFRGLPGVLHAAYPSRPELRYDSSTNLLIKRYRSLRE